jgi:hypothetical protein
MVNYGCPGESTSSFMTGCAFSATQGYPLHNPYSGSQMAAALAFLQAHPGQVSPITVTLSANDVLALISSCGGPSNLTCVASGYPATLKQLSANLAQILGALRAAAPNATIILQGAYNPYAAADASTNVLAVSLNNALGAVASATGATLADVFTPFNLAQPQPQTICALTLFCTPLQDIHPTDLGYLTIAQVMWSAANYNQITYGLVVSFLSAQTGQGNVYFGSGPGCLGLVEVATQDLNPNSTVHVVHVTGNDLPGSVGDNGIVSGTTYAYENVTVTPAGAQVDTNGGKCYSTTATGL